MYLVVDQGNTRCKTAVFSEEGTLAEIRILHKTERSDFEELLAEFTFQACIVSSVRDKKPDWEVVLESSVPVFLKADSTLRLPIGNAYATPETLGFDRLAAAVGAWEQQPGKPLLIVDYGTAVTYDFVTPQGVFIGGNIAPGLQTRFRSLHEYTGRLPLVEPVFPPEKLGKSTQTAIQNGVMRGMLFELEGYLNALREDYPDLLAFLTGGDLNYFAGKLKNGIFADENLVLKGLHRILRQYVNP